MFTRNASNSHCTLKLHHSHHAVLCSSVNKKCYMCKYYNTRLSFKQVTRLVTRDILVERVERPLSNGKNSSTKTYNETVTKFNETREDTVTQNILFPACHNDKVKLVECLADVEKCYVSFVLNIIAE